ncbi:hypothetical protein [Parasutterella excrementihominis]|uniref:hypothetical protein n=1 Tax=Parasutterella excrementihominis TaxID=487175 RepID=UPI0022E6B8CF|nr:hypothetical protein [Parasutterella excrementihominis]
MNVDREQQREILNLLFEHYPWRSSAVPKRISEMIEEDEGRTIGNILYLQMHGLIEPCIKIGPYTIEYQANVARALGNPNEETKKALGVTCYKFLDRHLTLTAKGIDFLLGDEGLSSVLNSQTVKLELNSTKLIIDYFINQSNLSEEERDTLSRKLKSVPGAVLQEYLTKLLADKIPIREVLDALTNML